MMDGVLNIYKPEGMSSFDVVRAVKRMTGMKKVGHAGTLDPAASGILPVCVGRATKIIDYIMNDYKIYNVEMKLGVITDTYDKEGSVISEVEVHSSNTEVINTVMSFVGESNQIPPMYSAIKVKGMRLYELARKGIEIERTSRKINIFNIEILSIEIPYVKFRVKCSKGTYIRSLCYDIGEKLGCGAMMSNLEREATGQFVKSDSVNILELTGESIKEFFIPIDDALGNFDKVTVGDKLERLLLNGVSVKDKTLIEAIVKDRQLRIYNSQGSLLGIGIRVEDTFKLTKLLL